MQKFAEVYDILRNKKSELSDKYALNNIAIFGCYAREEQTDESDVDI